ALPKVKGEDLEFRKVTDFGNLEKAGFGIMEPKDRCSVVEDIDLVLVPTVGITRSGVRLGYGFGYYDRFLKKTSSKTIALTYAKQIVRHIPQAENDVKVNWIVTESECIDVSKEG
ncbi:MAG: 5-formyltetrahydrofolate cyclo-ligase, partial [Thermoproteota archaeon]